MAVPLNVSGIGHLVGKLVFEQSDAKAILSSSFQLKLLVLAVLSVGINLQIANAQDAGALQRELDLQLQRELKAPLVQPPKPIRKQDLEASGEKITLSGFRYRGNTLFTSHELDTVTEPWLNRPVSFNDLKEATVAIQNFYSDHGRIAQASFPPQDIENGIVLIDILEARMGEVEITTDAEPSRFSASEARSYFSSVGLDHQLIETQPLERGLLLLNEVPGVSATGAFEPGKDTGTTNFKVGLTDTPFVTGQISASNYGAASTGVAQAVGVIGMNNLSGFGDQLNFNAIQSWGSSYVVANYNSPVGASGWKAGGQASYLYYRTLSDWSDVQTQGSSNTVSANLSYALVRTPMSQSTIKFNVEQRNYNNLQSGNTISNYQINAGSLGLSGNNFYSDRSILSYGASLTVGHLSINDLTQEGQDLTGPGTAGAYGKLSFNLSLKQELSVLQGLSWSNSIYGQFANKNLNSSEQIYMGGPYAVRAYPVTQGGGSQGLIFNSELNYRIDSVWQIGAFTDVGIVQQYVNTYDGWQGLTNANNSYVLGDVGLSGRFTYEQATLEAALAFRVGNNPLYNSTGQQLNADNTYKAVQGWIRGTFYF